MANKYWVGGGSSTNWNASSNTNWATSSGGTGNQTAPTTGDSVFFDANSGAGTSVCNASISLALLDCTGFTGTLTVNASVTLTISTGVSNSFKLNATMTFNGSWNTSNLITFSNTSGTAVLTSAGHTIFSVTVNGVGGTVQQADNLTIGGAVLQNAAFTLTNGTFDMNGFAFATPTFASSNSNTRSFLCGTTLSIGGNVTSGSTVWTTTTITGLTFTKNSCSLIFVSPLTNIAQLVLAFSTLSLPATTFNNLTTGTSYSISGACTFASLTVGYGNTFYWATNTTYTITAAFTIAGTAPAPISFSSSGVPTFATLSCGSGACTLNFGVLFNMTGAGGATFTATNTYQTGQNSGWAVTPPADASSAGIVSAVWQDLLSSADFSTGSSVGALIKSLSNLQYTVPATGRGTVTTGGSTTSIPTSAYSPAPSASVGNQLNGHGVLFDQNTATVALRGQVALILATSASATPTFTVSALTAAPASGDTFSVI